MATSDIVFPISIFDALPGLSSGLRVTLSLNLLLHVKHLELLEKSPFSLEASPEELCSDVHAEPVLDSLPQTLSSDNACFSNSTFEEISILHVNIRGWRTHCYELEAYLADMQVKPKIVCVNESFLNRGCPAELYGYTLVGRRDPPVSSNTCFTDALQTFGGVLVFVMKSLDVAVVEILNSAYAERLWFLVHTDIGPILLGAMYRPPSQGNVETLTTLETEFRDLRENAVGSILVGDFNCHNVRWLRFSAGMSTEGRALHRFAMSHGLEQIVRETLVTITY